MRDKPIYAVEEIHLDGTRTVLWPRPRRRPGWWLMVLVAWDALLSRRPSGDGRCTHCGEPLHRDGYCTPYPDDRGRSQTTATLPRSRREDLI